MTLGQAYRQEEAVLLLSKGQRLLQHNTLEWTIDSIACFRKDDNDQGKMKVVSEIFLSPPSPAGGSIVTAESPPTFYFNSHENSWLIVAPPLAQYDAVKELTIVTYNILHDNNHPAVHRGEDLVAALTNIDADVVCLQEVTDELLSLFLDDGAIRSRWKWCNRGPGAMESERNILVFSKENLPFSWQRVVLGGKHKAAVIASIQFFDPTSDDPRTLVIAAIHLTAGLLPKHLSAKSCEFQALIQYLQRCHGEDDWVIAGDTNLPSAHTLSPVIDSLCIDAWDAYHGPDGTTYDATYDPTRNALAQRTAREDKSPQRYDRIYIKRACAIQVSSIDISDKFLCSDHWPLRAQLAMHTPDKRTLPTTRVLPNAISFRDDVGLQKQNKDHEPDTELRRFLESSNAIPFSEHVQRKERVIHNLRRTFDASDGSGSPLTDSVTHAAQNDAQPTNSVRLVLVPVGSYALGVDFPDSDVDCIIVGNVSSTTFWSIVKQKLISQAKDNNGATLVNLKRFVKDAAVQMMVLEVDGVKVDLQYCPSAALAEKYVYTFPYSRTIVAALTAYT